MKPVHRAIVFLQQARDIIDEEANYTIGADNGERLLELQNAAYDIGSILCNLEQLDGTP